MAGGKTHECPFCGETVPCEVHPESELHTLRCSNCGVLEIERAFVREGLFDRKRDERRAIGTFLRESERRNAQVRRINSETYWDLLARTLDWKDRSKHRPSEKVDVERLVLRLVSRAADEQGLAGVGTEWVEGPDLKARGAFRLRVTAEDRQVDIDIPEELWDDAPTDPDVHPRLRALVEEGIGKLSNKE